MPQLSCGNQEKYALILCRTVTGLTRLQGEMGIKAY